jgi:hypothetical protein
MPIVRVYQSGTLVDTKPFDVQFMIFRNDDDTLFWETYDERKHSRRGGSVEIWVQMGALPVPRISYVLPTWRLIVDGRHLAHMLHSDVPVLEHNIVLEYKNYRFELAFDDSVPAA